MRVNRKLLYPAAAILAIALAFFALDGCRDREPEQRKAFIALLRNTVIDRKGIALEPLSRADTKLIGIYADHFAILYRFQKDAGTVTEKNARELLALSRHENLEALAGAGKTLQRATREAEAVEKAVKAVHAEADAAKAALKQPEDLAPVFDAAYAKIVTAPATATATAFAALKAKFEADMAFIRYVAGHSMDMDIAGNSVNIKNPGVIEDVETRMAEVRAKAAAFDAAREAMRKAASE